VLTLPHREKDHSPEMKGKFSLPYINSKYIVPSITIVGFSLLFYFIPDFIISKFIITSETVASNIPMLIFFVVWIVLAVLSFIKNLSLIPVLGLLSCCYLLTGMEALNWIWFSVWLLIGLVVYFMYGFRKSKLNFK
jgi:APA family basic amino acid/polyamine antiporter